MIITLKKIVTYKLSIRFSISRNYYDLLQVSQGAAFKQIKEKYLAKSKQYHPDVRAGSHDHYHLIQQAYKVLISPQNRKKYDLSLGIQQSLWQRQLAGHQFSDQFQSQAFDELLKSKEGHAKNHKTMNSIQQRLHELFKTQIQTNNPRLLLTNFNFMASLVGIGMGWLIWTIIQTVLLNYKGEVQHEVKLIHTDTTLKVIPLISR